MWDQKTINKLFPSGQLPSTHSPTETLLDSNYDCVRTQECKVARDMVYNQEAITWTPDGKISREILYNVYPFQAIDQTPALSVYGGKMVQNWLQLSKYCNAEPQPYNQRAPYFNTFIKNISTTNSREELEDAGFNYTGL